MVPARACRGADARQHPTCDHEVSWASRRIPTIQTGERGEAMVQVLGDHRTRQPRTTRQRAARRTAALALMAVALLVALVAPAAAATVAPTSSAATVSEPPPRQTEHDAAGNRYDLGFFTGTVAFGPGPHDTLTATNKSAFVASYTPGGALRWVHRIVKGFVSDWAYMAVTPGGMAVVTGPANGPARISTPYGDRVLPAFGGFDTYTVEFGGADGHIVFARSDGGAGNDQPYAVALDAFGNIYEVGGFGQTATFAASPTPVALTSGLLTDGFAVSFAANGTLRWAVALAAGPKITNAYGLAVSGGAVFVEGPWTGTAAFGSVTAYSAAASNWYISRLGTSDGAVAWTRVIRPVTTTAGDGVVAFGPVVQPGGDFTMYGHAWGDVGFGAVGYPATTTFSPAGGSQGFTVRYAPNGFLKSVTASP